MRGIVYGLLFSMILNCAGCLAMKKAYVAIHDSIDEALTNAPAPAAVVTNIVPEATKPVTGTANMTQVTPLVPYLGADDAAVDARLYADWKAGIENGCGGLPGDVRPLGIRLNGKTFGWKDVILSGAVKIQLNGNMMTITDGEYKGQLWAIHGASDHEMPPNGKPETLEDWTPLQSGVEGPKKHFAYFRCWE